MKNILSIAELTQAEILDILDRADFYLNKIQTKQDIKPTLKGKILLNVFFENSTRTRVSFEMGAIRLGASVVNFNSDTSSLKKGETITDTLQTLDMMHADIFVVRAKNENMPELAKNNISCPVINAGNGTKAHPTQALLDALALKRYRKDWKDMTVAICGDVKHSRVAGSNISLFKKFGVNIRLIGPEPLLPNDVEGVELQTNMDTGIKDADVIMLLRVQKERMADNIWFNERAYAELYGLTKNRLNRCAKDAIVMHPGPLNRGIEIADDVADDKGRTLILRQVEAGVAVRMACLEKLLL